MPDRLKEWQTEVTDFLAQLDVGAEARLKRDLRKLATKRHKLRDITKPLGDGLFELKTSYKNVEYRSVYVFHNLEIIILLCFVKKKQKTPKAKLDLAKSRYSSLIRREVVLGHVTLH